MNEVQNQVFQIETSCIKDNQVLALSVTRQDIERCSRFIREYGIVTPPVIGNCPDGTKRLLSGECEFLSLKEIGAKNINAVAVPVVDEDDSHKLSLLLSSIPRASSALSEAILISQLIKARNYTQLQISELLGKSPAWVNKRVSLATKLHPAVCEMVIMKQLCPHSAQEISRLPNEMQHGFAINVLRDSIPKSGVEVLTAALNKQDCPQSLKEQIISEPRHALTKIQELGVKASPVKDKKDCNASIRILRNDFLLLIHCIKDIEEQISKLNPTEIISQKEIALSARALMLRLCGIVDAALTLHEISPGKPRNGDELNVN
ncbi:ParB/RepB/Spo0J family partition protein [Acetivibrio cellulolyticus]|uniref:ParB/RepB/Spo0J family partition protein n=1 Tax=Acetivibrio cellulolyticus TaxID=35830 RepID=UPI0001E2F5E8|nr:hypothetical protein [Acetivibrio cellulolyticus]